MKTVANMKDGFTKHRERRQQRLVILDEVQGDCHRAAVEALKRGLYSSRTSIGDIEATMMRTKAKRGRQGYDRPNRNFGID